MKLVVSILIVGIIGFLGYLLFLEYSFASYKTPAEAEVTAIEVKKSRRKGNSTKPISYKIHIKYTPINGSQMETTFKTEQKLNFQVGQTIPIFYHARYPKNVRYRRTPTLAY